MTQQITITFTVSPADLAEVIPTLLDAPSRGTQADLVDLIQWALYDSVGGPQIEGYFTVIKEKTTPATRPMLNPNP